MIKIEKYYLSNEIKDQEKHIFERAKRILKKQILTEEEKESLLHIDIEGELFDNYDSEDMSNHNFDLGMHRAFKQILETQNS